MRRGDDDVDDDVDVDVDKNEAFWRRRLSRAFRNSLSSNT